MTAQPPWHQLPIPRRWHWCKPATTGTDRTLGIVERCACGAIRFGDGPWLDKNARRKAAKRKPGGIVAYTSRREAGLE